MTSRTKIGVLLALAAVFGLMGMFSLDRSASADSTSLTVAPTTVPPGGSATVSIALTTSGGHSTTVTATPAGVAIFTAAGGGISACAAGLGTSTVTITEATCASTVAANGTLTIGCVLTGTVTITASPAVAGTTATASLSCSAVGGTIAVGGTQCPLATDTSDIRVCKVNQLGTPLSATFALVGPSGTIELVTSSSTAPTSITGGGAGGGAGTCGTDQTCARVLTTNLGIGSPGSLGILNLAAGVYSLTEITAPGGSIQIQIINGLGQIMPPGTPISVTVPCASTAACTFLYTNSQPLAGAASAAGSSVVAVIGGSTFGLTNRANVEIAPAPGSDDDARLDIRIRDSNNVTIAGAHVIVMTDKGRIAMRQDITQTPAITGYDAIEPPPPNFGTPDAGDPCDVGIGLSGTTLTGGSFTNPFLPSPSQQIQDGFTNDNGIVSACLFFSDDLVPGITPGRANITVIVENFGNLGPGTFGFFGATNLVLTGTITVVGPPASVRVTASPTSLVCGEKATLTATITDAVGQNVSDHTRVEIVSNFGSTIGGTGATLGFPGTGPVNPLSSSAAETFSGVATAFLLTSTEHVGAYEAVFTSGGSTGGFFSPGGLVGPFTPTAAQGNIAGTQFQVFAPPSVFGGTGVFSTAPVSAQVTVTCSLAAAPAAAVPGVAAPRVGEGIRPPNTGDAGLASSSSSGLYFAIAATVVFALAGVATVKVVRR